MMEKLDKVKYLKIFIYVIYYIYKYVYLILYIIYIIIYKLKYSNFINKGVISGTMRKKIFVSPGDLVLVAKRDF